MRPNIERINYEMEKQGVTVAQLAELAGVSRQWIYDIKNGQESATLTTLEALAKALKIQPKDLII